MPPPARGRSSIDPSIDADESLHDRQAEAGPAALRREERVEHAVRAARSGMPGPRSPTSMWHSCPRTDAATSTGQSREAWQAFSSRFSSTARSMSGSARTIVSGAVTVTGGNTSGDVALTLQTASEIACRSSTGRCDRRLPVARTAGCR